MVWLPAQGWSFYHVHDFFYHVCHESKILTTYLVQTSTQGLMCCQSFRMTSISIRSVIEPRVDALWLTVLVIADQLRIDVSTAEPPVSVHAYVPGTPLGLAPHVSVAYPIILSARARNSYFVQREAFNPLDMLKSPMMLMMLVTGGLLFATPYLMVSGRSCRHHF